MICSTCYRMLRGHEGLYLDGSFDLRFHHHRTSGTNLEDAANITGCCFCYRIWQSISKLDEVIARRNGNTAVSLPDFITAFLLNVPQEHGIYRLEFKLASTPLATFLLEQNDDIEFRSYTPTDSTNSKETLELARYWVKECTSDKHKSCPNGALFQIGETQPYYPSCLIDLRSQATTAFCEPLGLGKDPVHKVNEDRVHLIETSNHRLGHDQPPGYYVTLSHCWGKAAFTQLKKYNLSEFKQMGISVSTLPQTFRDAIHFARRLSPEIRYLWIDSLNIVQDDKADWDSESMQMYEVYRNSFCDISATAAANSEQGLYAKRDRRRLWEDEINLNITGLRGPLNQGLLLKTRAQKKRRILSHLGPESLVQRCIVRDISFWDCLVENAPVNRRGWVLQERLLAPRVLHFCENQIAWECRELDAAESCPDGLWGLEPNSQKTLRERIRLKDRINDTSLPEFCLNRKESNARTDWKALVEQYSSRQLTYPHDRLLALVGIAQAVKQRIRGGYVAGMWEENLGSQFLWRVDPAYDKGQLSYPSRRPTFRVGSLRPPSFSWAAVEAPQGIKYAETRKEKDLQVSVETFHGIPKRDSVKFGLVENDCYIEISCSMHKVEMGSQKYGDGIHYSWSLLEGEPGSVQCDLDSPQDDFHLVQGPGRGVYCVPVYMDPTAGLQCLLLQEETGLGICYSRRVGYTLIQNDLVRNEPILDILWPKGSTSPRRTIRIA